jgi:hypothetical protein
MMRVTTIVALVALFGITVSLAGSNSESPTNILAVLSLQKHGLRMTPIPGPLVAQSCGREYTRCVSTADCCNFLSCQCTDPTRPGDSRECQCR